MFAACYELRPAFELLLRRPDKLTLVTGELWPSQRILADEEDREVAGEVVMEGVEHLGQYVYEMSVTKLQELRAEQGLPEELPSAKLKGRAIPDVLDDIAEAEPSDEEEDLTRGSAAGEDDAQ